MSSADDHSREQDTQPRPEAGHRRDRRAPALPEPKPAGMRALEQALSEAGKELKDLI
ncbi:hypothetical protein [Nonomuraea phyllanthi]|uniref:hypothetical protein n=1 Tax=Nonomuraea phyllanthi TaxID=2219224 RepID=UPI0018852361|nr:hypothetical protein [Nonomuraea phyllanthi]